MYGIGTCGSKQQFYISHQLLFNIPNEIQDFQIDGSNGWVLHNDEFSNQYYAELIGGDSASDPVDVLINDAPAWRRIIENGVRFWQGLPNGVRIIMVRNSSYYHRKFRYSNNS